MGRDKRRLLLVVVVLLLVAIGALQRVTDPMYARIEKRARPAGGGASGDLMVQLPGQFIVASLTGFKEVVAGALWIRADTFFHSGDYQAIVPIVRLVTWLDPHNIDVYTTGAWHLDYNFVDRNQMSDKRYIPASIALLKEGIRNNPNIWDLYFELGWTHYNKKLMDYREGLKWIKLACTKNGFDPNTGRMVPRFEFVDRMLAHQYEKIGDFAQSVKEWRKARTRVEGLIKVAKKKHYDVDVNSLDVCDRNLSLLLLRLAWRYGDMSAYREGLEIANRVASRKDADPMLKQSLQGAERDYAARMASGKKPHDALTPLDLGFEVSWSRARDDKNRIIHRVLRVEGKINLVRASEYKDLASESFTHWYADNEKAGADQHKVWRDGCRVYWMLRDYDYDLQRELERQKTFSWRIDTSKTIVWDSFYVQGGEFNDKIDLSVSDEFYPLKSDKYKLTIWVTPEEPGCPDYVQDRVGWRGEAFRSPYLDTTTRPGFRMLRKEYILDRKDII